ncbi:MAG: transposase [Prochloraceae cyanobacterium]|nr:transposase [Prochloraceae cyanobacterium]
MLAIIKFTGQKSYGKYALPKHEFGLDVIAFCGQLRYQEHRSIAQIHKQLVAKNLNISERSVGNLLNRYDELISAGLTDRQRLKEVLKNQKYSIISIDGLQPHSGHEVLWIIRDCISEEILLARSLLSSSSEELAKLIKEVKDLLPIRIEGVISDGQQSIEKAVSQVLPAAVHQLCHYHYLKEAVKPVVEDDRNANKELKKLIRGVRPLEKSVDNREDLEGKTIQEYCSAVRASLTDKGKPPFDPPGIKLQKRLTKISSSLEKVKKKSLAK